ncbi:hypothetical protein AURDEDRAFT_175672 [Auricularia subglabra TFB-10046 SS5]|uniref:Uncharacterized protein n=1 Tax=Auricularia subglabra (strain TFB-10046 / SS5) TaxID=717982 RepID=J0D7Y1_AURST|nr:hypothetical protein AURDEDRAFT_175672 [Auricularia subglabra TFB-10046 SS5]
MPLVTVRAHDAGIEFFGSSWKDDLFEIRPGIDPPGGGGVNDTAGGACALGVRSRETWGFGNGFRLTFTGISVRLVMESRQDHGIYLVDVDGTQSTVSGYSEAPHCGVLFSADNLPQAKHTVSATLKAKSPASTWEYSYMQLFAIQYDPGSSSSSTGQTPQSAHGSSAPRPTPTTRAVLSSRKAFSAADIAGVTIAGFVLAFGLFVLAVWLFRRCRRRRRFSAVPAYDASEKPLRMRRGKGRRRSVLSDVPSPYMLHHAASASSLGVASIASPGSTLPDYARDDPFSGSSISPFPLIPPPASTKSRAGYASRSPAPIYPPAPSQSYAPIPSPSPSPSYPPSSSRSSEKGRRARVMTPPPPPEDGGTMLPPYRSN